MNPEAWTAPRLEQEDETLEAWVTEHPDEARQLILPERFRKELVPPRVFEVADRPDHVEISTHPYFPHRLHLIVSERGAQRGISSPEDWEKYQAIRDAEKAASPNRFRTFVQPTTFPGVDPSHIRNAFLIDQGHIGIDDRLLMVLGLSAAYADSNVLEVSKYEGEIGSGIATDLYRHTLPDVARKLGFRYVIGSNNDQNGGFFVDKIGRSKVSDLDLKSDGVEPDLAHALASATTVQFLYEEDREKFLKRVI